MRVYVELARSAFRQQFAYRAATLSGLFTNSIFGVMIASVFLALFASRPDSAGGEVAGWTAEETLTYVWINQSLIKVVEIWGWWEIMRTIQSGAIASDLFKPINFFAYWLSRDLGRALAQVLIRMVPTFGFGLLLYRFPLPGDPQRWLAFAVSVILAIIVSFGFRFLLNVTGFWVIDHRGMHYVSIVLVNFFSGFLVPLAFFPDWLRAVAYVLPFRAMAMIPNEVLLDQRPIFESLSLQLFWCVALAALGLLMLRQGERKLVLQGG